MIRKSQGLILKKLIFKDSDLILKVLLCTGDKISLIAKAALKSQRRFGGGILDPLNYVEIIFKDTPSKELLFLNEAHLLYDFKGLRKDYERLRLALYFLNILIQTELSKLDAAVFNLAFHSLKSLEKTKHPSILRLQFEIKFLRLQGVLENSPQFSPFLKTSLYKAEFLNQKINFEDLKIQISSQIENYIERSFHI